MNANRRMSAYDISKSRFLSKTFIVAMIRQVRGSRSTSASGEAVLAPCGHDRETVRPDPGAVYGRITGCPDRTVNSWPNARSKCERFSSSITSH